MRAVLWDVHCHFPRDWEQPEGGDPAPLIDARADALREAGVTRASLLSGGRFGPSYDAAIEQARRHEDLFVPVAVVDPGESWSGEIRRLHELGYRGLKIIGTRHSYDDYRYFGVYGAAEELRMPILFHLGVIGGGVDYARTHPRRDPEAAETLRRVRERGRMQPRDVSAARMRPFHLDGIANSFPQLPIIGAHMGGSGNYDEAASVARWRHHVLFDLSGGETIERHAVERRLVGHEIGVEKLVWGSDCRDDEIGAHVESLDRILDEVGLSASEAARIRYHNAAELFGEEEPRLAGE
jgi:predicted TIM-barrel fold metal-dependent hydrolase